MNEGVARGIHQLQVDMLLTYSQHFGIIKPYFDEIDKIYYSTHDIKSESEKCLLS